MKITRKKQEKPFPKLMITTTEDIICALEKKCDVIRGINTHTGICNSYNESILTDYTPTPEPLPFPKFMIHKENGNVIYLKDRASHVEIGPEVSYVAKLSDYEDFYGTVSNDI